ncbi:OLC1v1024331C1 [Oldenlandia corymbosa var. corymbosa]|uniref:OLC1v1024331C1 n=1 Tax=Oldenlandia corymbosa var. corymbosa TaxID=529605 RepID=A0AAV1C243_OLDCO|nr:OLC1v1024331C1 [Oldenlandia corymbosa var. corymbosa]
MDAGNGKIEYARICVEIDPQTELPDTVTLKGPGGIRIEQKLEYEWVPAKCTHCICFGHSSEHCKSKPRKQWSPKQPTNEDNKLVMASDPLANGSTSKQEDQIGSSSNNIQNTKSPSRTSVEIIGTSLSKVLEYGDTSLSKREGTSLSEDREATSHPQPLSRSAEGDEMKNNLPPKNTTHDDAANDADLVEISQLATTAVAITKGQRTFRKAKGKGDIIAVLETKVHVDNIDSVTSRCCSKPMWHFVHNFELSLHSRILVMWNTSKFFATFIYAHNSMNDRVELWKNLECLASSISSEWILLGDFNCIASTAERMNGRSVTSRDTMELQTFMSSQHVTDIPYNGCFFTWSDKRQNGPRICSKLDRIMASFWMNKVQSHAYFQPPGVSDHSPGVVEILPHKVFHPPFRFCNFWTSEEDFLYIVTSVWQSIGPPDNLFGLQRNIKLLKHAFKEKFSKMTRSLAGRIKETRNWQHEIQKDLFISPIDTELLAIESPALTVLNKLIKNEMLFLKQRARVKWSLDGDLNTSYFHACIKNKTAMGSINTLYDPNGNRLTDPDSIKAELLDYFRVLLGMALPEEYLHLLFITFGKQGTVQSSEPNLYQNMKL